MANALSFDGTGDYVTYSDIFDFSGTSSMTVLGRMYLDGTQPNSFPEFISKSVVGSPRDGWWGFYYVAGGELRWRREDGTAGDLIGISVSTGTWFDFCLRYDGSSMYIDIDGSSATPVSSTRSLPGNAKNLVVGKPSEFGSGEIAADVYNFSIWTRSISDTEYDFYRGQYLTGNESGLASYWKFDEGTGTSIADSVGANTGTITNSTWISTAPDLPTVGLRAKVHHKRFHNRAL